MNWTAGFSHLIKSGWHFSIEEDCIFKSRVRENISVCQVAAKPSWKKNIQQLSPARGPNIQSLSPMINDICQLTKQIASTIWGHGPVVHSAPVKPAKSTLRWEKASLCVSPLERGPRNKQPLCCSEGSSSLGAETLVENICLGKRRLHGPGARLAGTGLEPCFAGGHALCLCFCWDPCPFLQYPLDPIVLA